MSDRETDDALETARQHAENAEFGVRDALERQLDVADIRAEAVEVASDDLFELSRTAQRRAEAGAMQDAGDVEEHLRAASDAILVLLAEVGQLERHKRGVHPNDPRFDELAGLVRKAAERLAEFTAEEEKWARGASEVQGVVEPIDASQSRPTLTAILARWRDVERRLDAAEPGSAEAATLFDAFEQIRAEYMDEFRKRMPGD